MSEYDDIPQVTRDEVPADAVILDVREDDEWDRGHIANAVHVPIDRLANRMHYEPGELLSDEPLVVVCRGGGSRSARATAWLNANGFEAVQLVGGTRGWMNAGLPMDAANGEPIVDSD